jgi:hypothetical protein
MACLSPSNEAFDAGEQSQLSSSHPEVGGKLTTITKANGVLDRFYNGHIFGGKL